MRAASTLATALAALAIGGPAYARDARVTATTPSTAYIDVGAADGLSVGQTWEVSVGGKRVSVTVAAVASHDAVLEVGGGPVPAIGAVLALPPGLTPPTPVAPRPPPPPPQAWGGPPPGALDPVRTAASANQPPPGDLAGAPTGVQISGEISANVFVAGDLGNTSTSYHDVGLASQLAIDSGAWHYDHLLEAHLAGSPEIFFAPLQNAKARFDVYLLRLAYEPAGARLAAALGRQPGAPLGELGSIDGGRARVRIGGGLDATLFGGLRPATDLTLVMAPRVGADLGWSAPADGGTRARFDAGVAVDAWKGALDRAVAASSLDLASGGFYARADGAVDLATDAGDKTGARLTRAAGMLRSRRGAVTAAASVAYDRPFLAKSLLAEVPELAYGAYGARTTASVSLDYALAGHLTVGGYASGSRGDDFMSGFFELPVRWASGHGTRLTLAPHAIVGSLVDEIGGRASLDFTIGRWELGAGGSFDRLVAGGITAMAGVGRASVARPFWRRWRTAVDVEVAAGDGNAKLFLFGTLAYRLSR